MRIHALAAAAALGLVAAQPASASLALFQSFTGTYDLSTDGCATTTQACTLTVNAPVGATVVGAYLYTSTFSSFAGAGGTFGGQAVSYTALGENNAGLEAGRADVTSIVAPVVNGGAGGAYSFRYTETSGSQDGGALVLVYSKAGLATSTIGILDGFSATTGDSAFISFASGLDKNAPGFRAEMRIGDGFSFNGTNPQAPDNSADQVSTITVNGSVMTTVAGHCDDALESCTNGNLLTMGDDADAITPLNPSKGQDHERYDLSSFINAGDTIIRITTRNPSSDDNIFLAVFAVTGEGFVSTEEPPPSNSVPEPLSIATLASALPASPRRVVAVADPRQQQQHHQCEGRYLTVPPFSFLPSTRLTQRRGVYCHLRDRHSNSARRFLASALLKGRLLTTREIPPTMRIASLAAAAALGLVAAQPASAALALFQSFTGTYDVSTDGCGTTAQACQLTVNAPVGATVVGAYLYTSTFNSFSGAGGTFNGNAVTYTPLGLNAGFLQAGRADVTSIVAPIVNGGAGGAYSFAYAETNAGQDGGALVLVYSKAGLATSTIGILDGFSATTGDSAFISFASGLDKSAPGFRAEMRIGDGFSFNGTDPQAPTTQNGQVSTIRVNGSVMTNVAGHCDDAQQSCTNGNLFTMGDDADPITPLNPTIGQDHERYDLSSFINSGDTVIRINTLNPSNDDNIFLAVFAVTGEGFVSTEEPPPSNSVPEPLSIATLGLGLAGLAAARRRRR